MFLHCCAATYNASTVWMYVCLHLCLCLFLSHCQSVCLSVLCYSRLFAAINANEGHVLRGLFPPSRPHLRYELRPRPHGFLLPTKDDRNFISRVLFKNIY